MVQNISPPPITQSLRDEKEAFAKVVYESEESFEREAAACVSLFLPVKSNVKLCCKSETKKKNLN